MSTITVSTSGRLTTATATASDVLRINSGVTVMPPYRTSMACLTLSCLGTGSAAGRIAVPATQGFVSVLKIGNNTLNLTGCSYGERTTGATVLPRGGGAI